MCILAGTPCFSMQGDCMMSRRPSPSPVFLCPWTSAQMMWRAMKQRPLSAVSVHRSDPACHSSVLKKIKSRATHPGYGEHVKNPAAGHTPSEPHTGGACPEGIKAASGSGSAAPHLKTEHPNTNWRLRLPLEASFNPTPIPQFFCEQPDMKSVSFCTDLTHRR